MKLFAFRILSSNGFISQIRNLTIEQAIAWRQAENEYCEGTQWVSLQRLDSGDWLDTNF